MYPRSVYDNTPEPHSRGVLIRQGVQAATTTDIDGSSVISTSVPTNATISSRATIGSIINSSSTPSAKPAARTVSNSADNFFSAETLALLDGIESERTRNPTNEDPSSSSMRAANPGSVASSREQNPRADALSMSAPKTGTNNHYSTEDEMARIRGTLYREQNLRMQREQRISELDQELRLLRKQSQPTDQQHRLKSNYEKLLTEMEFKSNETAELQQRLLDMEKQITAEKRRRKSLEASLASNRQESPKSAAISPKTRVNGDFARFEEEHWSAGEASLESQRKIPRKRPRPVSSNPSMVAGTVNEQSRGKESSVKEEEPREDEAKRAKREPEEQSEFSASKPVEAQPNEESWHQMTLKLKESVLSPHVSLVSKLLLEKSAALRSLLLVPLSQAAAAAVASAAEAENLRESLTRSNYGAESAAINRHLLQITLRKDVDGERNAAGLFRARPEFTRTTDLHGRVEATPEMRQRDIDDIEYDRATVQLAVHRSETELREEAEHWRLVQADFFRLLSSCLEESRLSLPQPSPSTPSSVACLLQPLSYFYCNGGDNARQAVLQVVSFLAPRSSEFRAAIFEAANGTEHTAPDANGEQDDDESSDHESDFCHSLRSVDSVSIELSAGRLFRSKSMLRFNLLSRLINELCHSSSLAIEQRCWKDEIELLLQSIVHCVEQQAAESQKLSSRALETLVVSVRQAEVLFHLLPPQSRHINGDESDSMTHRACAPPLSATLLGARLLVALCRQAPLSLAWSLLAYSPSDGIHGGSQLFDRIAVLWRDCTRQIELVDADGRWRLFARPSSPLSLALSGQRICAALVYLTHQKFYNLDEQGNERGTDAVSTSTKPESSAVSHQRHHHHRRSLLLDSRLQAERPSLTIALMESINIGLSCLRPGPSTTFSASSSTASTLLASQLLDQLCPVLLSATRYHLPHEAQACLLHFTDVVLHEAGGELLLESTARSLRLTPSTHQPAHKLAKFLSILLRTIINE